MSNPEPIAQSLTLLLGEHQPSTELLSKTQFHTNPSISRKLFMDPDILHYPLLSTEIVQNLMNQFPHVIQANIIINECDTSVNLFISELLDFWSRKIESLNIWTRYTNPYSSQWEPCDFNKTNFKNLFDAINRLSVLKVLTFECFNMIFRIDLSILSSIEKFYFYSYDDAELLHNSLSQYASGNPKLSELKISNSIKSKLTLEKYLKFDQEFANQFVHLNLGEFWDIDEICLQNLSSKFENLNSLQLNLGYLNLSFVSKCLSALKSLEHLILDVNTTGNIKQRKLHENVNSGFKISYVDAFPCCVSQSISKLSVRVWNSLNYHHELDNQLNSFVLDSVLPNVQVLHYYNDTPDCRVCGYVNYGFGIEERMECTRKFLIPLRKCKNLKRIVVEYEAMNKSEGRVVQIEELW